MSAPKDPKKYKRWKKNLVLSWKNPSRKKLMIRILKNREFSKEWRRKMSESAKKRVGKLNPFYGRKHTEESKRKISMSNKGNNSARYGKPAWNKGLKYDYKTRIKMSKIAKMIHKKNPDIRNKISIANRGRKFSKEHKNKIREKLKSFYVKNPNFRKLENNPLWYGGISFEPYNILFNKEFKKNIKDKYDNKCLYCKGVYKCGVHHINYIKKHSSIINCIPACVKCNFKFNVNRDYWFAYFCYLLNIKSEDNLKEAEKVLRMNRTELINFMKNEYGGKNGK